MNLISSTTNGSAYALNAFLNSRSVIIFTAIEFLMYVCIILCIKIMVFEGFFYKRCMLCTLCKMLVKAPGLKGTL